MSKSACMMHPAPSTTTTAPSAHNGSPDTAPITRVLWPDESATRAFAMQLARQPDIANAFIELRGELGAGKTTLVRHVLQALGVSGRIKSPTYAVVEPYEVPWPFAAEPQRAHPPLSIFHFDFYRFSDPQEWEDAGFRDLFAHCGLKLAEWPDNAAGFLPPADLSIEIETTADGSRSAVLHAHSPCGQQLVLLACA